MQRRYCQLRRRSRRIVSFGMAKTNRLLRGIAVLGLLVSAMGVLFVEAAADPRPAPASAPAAGGPIRRAPTGHVSNYDEAKVGMEPLPDPLRLSDGQPVRDASMWYQRRRHEIMATYEQLVYGRVPTRTPGVRVEVVSEGDLVRHGLGVRTRTIIHFGPAANGPKADVVLYRPVHGQKSPVLLQLVFAHGLEDDGAAPANPAAGQSGVGAPETGPIDEILRRGYAYATFRYTDVQPDHAGTLQTGVAALSLAPGRTKRAPDEWGTIGIWAWAASRVLDYLATRPELDGGRVALIGHSRLGKTVLWASACDPRFALVFSSCSGEMGAALSRRDYGETIDDMAARFPWQFAENFARFAGHWSELPVDAHMLIALSAPRPVFVTGGTEDQWADPRGEFLAEVAAGPVYRLLGQTDLGTSDWPGPDRPLTHGTLGWNYHTGPHAVLAADWNAFLEFADRHLH
jgi:hypothetical protein